MSVSLGATGAVFPSQGVCRGLRSGNKLLPTPACICKPCTSDLASMRCCSSMSRLSKGDIFLMKNTWSTFELYRVLLPGVVSTLLSRLCCPKISLGLKRKASMAYRHLVSVSSMVTCISSAMGLGSCIFCLRQQLLKSCCFLVKELHNMCLIALVGHSVTDPIRLWAISVSSRAVRNGTAGRA